MKSLLMPRVNPDDEPELNYVIGRRLRELRLAKGLSMEAVGEKVGVNYQLIQRYEYGKHNLTAVRLVSLARLFDVPVGYFFSEPSAQEKYTAPDAGLVHLMDRLQIIQRKSPIAFTAVQDMVRVLCNEIQGVRPTPRPHRRTKADQGVNTSRRRKVSQSS